MNNRRDFLKMLFGGLAAMGAAPAIVRDLVAAPVAKPAVQASASAAFQHLWIAQEFNLETQFSVLLRVPDDYFIRGLRVRFQDGIPNAVLDEVLYNVGVEMLMRGQTYYEAPISVITEGLKAYPAGFGFGQHHLNAKDDLQVNFYPGNELWKPPAGVGGHIIIEGVQILDSKMLNTIHAAKRISRG